MYDFYIKRNDTSPLFQATFLDPAGVAVPYTGATSVRFHLFDLDGTQIVDAAMTETTPADGVATYEWQAADTATGGIFKAESEVTFSDGTIQTFPNDGYWRVFIDEDLA